MNLRDEEILNVSYTVYVKKDNKDQKDNVKEKIRESVDELGKIAVVRGLYITNTRLEYDNSVLVKEEKWMWYLRYIIESMSITMSIIE